jgi:putative drug exporter of the RND superfamily
MSTSIIDPITPTGRTRRAGLAKWIRRLSIPIIVGWIALVVLLNVAVPQLEVVGQMRSVSISPSEVPSVIAMKRVGEVFEEFESDSAVMIVIEGDQPLGAGAHRFYDELIDRLEADTKHVEHVQDFWGDPLTEAGAQSGDGKAAYVQVYLVGNMGEELSNESVEAVNNLVAGCRQNCRQRIHGIRGLETGAPHREAASCRNCGKFAGPR